VGVPGREPAAVVDVDDVPVARDPARDDDCSCSSSMNRSSGSRTDVDALVHPAPAHSERARHRPVHRPDQAVGRGGRGRGGPRLRSPDLGCQRCALLLKGLHLAYFLTLLLGQAGQALAVLGTLSLELLLPGNELSLERPCLRYPDGDDTLLLPSATA